MTRQTVAAIEAGRYGPSAAVALRLAAALGRRVEEIFWLAEETRQTATWAVARPEAASGPQRVRLAQVDRRWWAWPIPAGGGHLTAADGLAEDGPGGAAARRAVVVRLLHPRAVLRNTVVIAGCEPALSLLAQHAFTGAASRAGRALWCEVPNSAAIAAVEEGRAHVAAVHGVQAAGPAFDLGLGHPVVPPPGYRVFHLARCRHGWLFHKRWAFQGAADLARGRLRLLNRQPGSGARALLDRALAAAGVDPLRVPGYDQVAAGHLELAAAIAAGRADVGVGVESAAMTHGLGFLPLQEERCELWVPAAHCRLAAVAELLAALCGGAFRADLSAVAPYDTAETGAERTPTALDAGAPVRREAASQRRARSTLPRIRSGRRPAPADGGESCRA